MMNKRNKVEDLKIIKESTLLETLKRMDQVDSKLLIVTQDNIFLGLISLGDIQRAIIANKKFETQIKDILRENVIVAYDQEPIEEVKQKMLRYRTEFMPVINKNKKIIDVLFWEDVFLDAFLDSRNKINIPVVIMAGGKGTRLKPITNIIPKALVPIGEKPIIELIINNFNKIGIIDFYISLNYKADMIKYYFNQIENKTYRLIYIQEMKPSGTAGSLSLLKGKLDKTFFVSNCDILVKQDYRDIYEYHKKNKNEITLVASLKNYKMPYGIINSGENGTLQNIIEKPDITYLINTGMYLLEPNLLMEIPDDTIFHITNLIEKVMKRNGRIGVFPISEKSLMDIGEWKLYQKTFLEINDQVS